MHRFYRYGTNLTGMELRYPEGFYDRMSFGDKDFKNYVIMRRKLTDEECSEYGFTYLGEYTN